MNELNKLLQKAVSAGSIPFVVAMVGTSKAVIWSGAAGEQSSSVPATEDTLFRIFSMTKGIGSTAAMILLERGKLSLNTPVEEILPEFSDIKVLDRFDDNKPYLRSPKTKATIRHLATHTSGCAYGIWNSSMAKYSKIANTPSMLGGSREALNTPLASDPGEQWNYGMGTDWLGLVVEAVDGRPIDKFCSEEIFEPLRMHDTVFEVEERLRSRLSGVKLRSGNGQFVDFDLAPPTQPEFYGMGQALYSTASDYMRFLRMFLNRGQLEGNRILNEATIDLMLANHIDKLCVGKLVTTNPQFNADLDLFPNIEKSHSLGFMRMEEDITGMRRAGSQFWAGVCNTHFWFDPTCDVASVVMTQSLPFLEPPFMQFYEGFEKAVYANIRLSD